MISMVVNLSILKFVIDDPGLVRTTDDKSIINQLSGKDGITPSDEVDREQG